MLVKDRMTLDPVTVTPDTSFPEAFRLIREGKIRHLPVVDEQGRLLGVVARTDLLRASPPAALSPYSTTAANATASGTVRPAWCSLRISSLRN